MSPALAMKEKSSRRGLGAIAAIVLIHLALAALAFQPAPHPGGDNAVYVSVARSILDGEYRDTFDPAAPRHVVYPPGFPLITAAALAIGLEPWVELKVVTMFFSALMVGLAWLYAIRDGRWTAVWVAGMLAISPGVLALSHWELSDVPFTAVTIAALLAWRRVVSNEGQRAIVVAAVLTLAAYSIRSAGLPLIVAAMAWLMINRRWKQVALTFAIVVLPGIAWWLYTSGQSGYFGQLATADAYVVSGASVTATGFLARIVENFGLYTGKYFPAMLTDGSVGWRMAITVPLLALAVYEWASRTASSRRSVLELFIPLYIGMILLWLPQFSGERLLLPIYPFILLYAALGAQRFAERIPGAGRVAIAVAALIIAGSTISTSAAAAQLGIACTGRYREGDTYPCVTVGWNDFYMMSKLSGTMLPDRSIVMSRKPAVLFAFSGNPGRLYPFDRDPQTLVDSARVIGARYVLLDYVDHVGPGYVVPAILRRSKAFCVMHTLGPNRATLFGIVAGAESIPDDRADPGKADVEAPFKRCGNEFFRDSIPPPL